MTPVTQPGKKLKPPVLPVPNKTMSEIHSFKSLLKERLSEILTSTITDPAGAVEIFMLGGAEAEASGSSSKHSQLKRY